ncbi:uncharacterized protein LOC114362564 [Ostrinia furnacalis]|uniref:uncharacterized protein LOC114362564 n=1 Tax=Ostrinia furnacalis TaxID=93504 RepID=UPI00103E9720|nr:uncharacterized protein LOC114362564 [Ostrinia furnacalis]
MITPPGQVRGRGGVRDVRDVGGVLPAVRGDGGAHGGAVRVRVAVGGRVRAAGAGPARVGVPVPAAAQHARALPHGHLHPLPPGQVPPRRGAAIRCRLASGGRCTS